MDAGIAEYSACRQTVGMFVDIALVDTTTTTIDIAGVDNGTCTVIVLLLLGSSEVGADFASLNLDIGVVPDVAVLGTTEDRAADDGVATDGDIGVAYIVIIGETEGTVGCGVDASASETSTIDVAVCIVTRGMVEVVGADMATHNVDRGETGSLIDGVSHTRHGFERTHGGQFAATVNVTIYLAVEDVDGSVDGDVGCDGIAYIALAGTKEVAEEESVGGVAGDIDLSATIDFGQFATTIDIAVNPDAVRGVGIADIHLGVGVCPTLVDIIALTYAVDEGALLTLTSTEDKACDAVGDMADVDYGRNDGGVRRMVGGEVGTTIEVFKVQIAIVLR